MSVNFIGVFDIRRQARSQGIDIIWFKTKNNEEGEED